MISATERRAGRLSRAAARLLALSLAGEITVAAAAAASPEAPSTPPAPLASAAELRGWIEKAENALDKAAGAARGNDPGRVSLILKKADDELARFEASSRLEELARAFAAGRAGSGGGDFAAAVAGIQRAREILPALADYTVTRQTEEAGRAALHAAQTGDGPGCLSAFDRLEAAVLAPVLLARAREARAAIARGRTAMVRRDLKGGAAEVQAARRAIDGLSYAGALSRSLFALRVGSELLAQRALVAARDQVQKGLRDLRHAADLAPEAQRDPLEQAYARGSEIW
ncbi:MAG TPA: hypothetical protein VFT43_09475, partial [Candidatus Polarisedimenticolia bacterium]|nr:hypothetical protein [Candidatus Polarisedimenticolia bacterium]